MGKNIFKYILFTTRAMFHVNRQQSARLDQWLKCSIQNRCTLSHTMPFSFYIVSLAGLLCDHLFLKINYTYSLKQALYTR